MSTEQSLFSRQGAVQGQAPQEIRTTPIRKIMHYVRIRTNGAWLTYRLGKTLDAKVKKFLVISAPRTGSNLFCGLMTSHPGAICFHEVFHPNGIFYGSPLNIFQFNFGSIENRDRDPLTFLQKLYSLDHGFPVVGMKIFPNHNEIVLHALIKMRDVKKIVLTRRDALHAFTSVVVARETRSYQNNDELTGTDQKTVNVDYNEFREFVIGREKFFGDIRAQLTGQKFYELDYLDVAKRSRKFWDVQEFLGLEFVSELKARMQPQSQGGLREKITNYDQLAEKLAGTSYAAYLDEESP